MSQLQIIIDVRENKIREKLELNTNQEHTQHIDHIDHIDHITYAQLDIGDIIYKYDDKILCLIERKSMSDYICSITDKRCKNQRIRINQFKKDNPDAIIIYIIEGQPRFTKAVSKSSLYSSWVNKIIRDQFTIIRVDDIDETIYYINKIYEKLIEHKLSIQMTSSSTINTEYLSSIKLSKKANLTTENCFILQLSQIQGISINIATEISKIYKSFKDLIHAYDNSTTESEKKTLLTKIPNAKIGKVLSERIYNYVYNPITETYSP